MAKVKTSIELTWNDVEFGCKEYGYIARPEHPDADEEDYAYECYMRSMTMDRVRVFDGILYIYEE